MSLQEDLVNRTTEFDARKLDQAVQAVAGVLLEHEVFPGRLWARHHQPRNQGKNRDHPGSFPHGLCLLPNVGPSLKNRFSVRGREAILFAKDRPHTRPDGRRYR